MNPWLSDPNPALNNHAGFGPSGDVSMSFLQPPQTINPAQFQNQPYLNGAGRTNSPAFHNPMYQTNSVVPSKRSREDSLGTSPRQAPNAPPGSRSQTPGQTQYSGFNPQANGTTPFSSAPNAFQHLQTSSNATPSPTIQQMNFKQQSGPQRVSTASPSPFSPQHNVHHASPGPSDHNSRVSTPHDAPQNFMPNTGFPPGFNPQQFQQAMNTVPSPMAMNQMNMNMAAMQQGGINPAQRAYQMQLQAQARQLAAQQARNANGMSGNPQLNMQNPQINQHDQPNGPQLKLNNTPEDFFRSLQTFSAAKGRPVDLNPLICGRPIQILRLYTAIVKGGGSARITKMNQWPLVASAMGFPPQQPQAASELQTYWLSNIGTYEQLWFAQQQRQRMAAQAQPGAPMTPTRDGQQGLGVVNHQRSQSDLLQAKNGPIPNQPQHSPMNGFATPVKDHLETGAAPAHRSSLTRQLDPTDLNGMQPQPHVPSPQKLPQGAVKTEPETESTVPVKKPIEEPFVPETIPPSRNHGPINVDEMFILGQHVIESKPIVPAIRELGVIDIHALIMAIKSGMHGETRVALDTLVTLSTEPSLQLSLVDCEDLMETLVDCAQAQVDYLAEHASEVSDEMSLPSYEELVRSCRAEAELIQEVPEFGSIEYDLDRAADRLICVTTLIRNFSFYEANFGVLGQPEVLQLLTTIIRHLGTKELPLRTSRNTLDFMKDVIIYLSNLSTTLALPGKQEALCLLHFLLAYAPTPSPVSATNDRVAFTTYSPSLHKYLPAAVDSLAKLLARDEPNRTHYKAIFAADANSTPAYELLTRTFGLAIAPIPTSTNQLRALIETRKPFLLQGMLAAEILAVLAPGSEKSLARSWLESEDCFAGSLLRLVSVLSSQTVAHPPPPAPGRGMPPQQEHDPTAYGAITSRAMAVLRTLVYKSRTFDQHGNVAIPATISLKKETLLGAMIQKDIDPGMLKQLCAYAVLED